MPILETVGSSVTAFITSITMRIFTSGVAEDTLFSVVARLKKFKPNRIRYENLVMLLGIGGVGKTTLIKHVTNNLEADNSVETVSSFNIYSTTRNVVVEDPDHGKRHEKVFLGFADYRGQNIGTLIRGIAGSDVLKPTSINTVILVVDLFPANRVYSSGKYINLGGENPQEFPNKERIEENDRVWSEQLLQAVLGMLDSNALQKIIVFINKVDLVTSHEGQESALSMYEPLVRRVKKFSEHSEVEFEVILGSIFTGHNFFKLEESLKYSAVER